MKEIFNKGNLPKPLQTFAAQLGGRYSDLASTKFFEMSSVDEMEKAACGQLDENIKFELVPAYDNTTNRGFLVGFETTEPTTIVITEYVGFKIYFIELSESEYNSWVKKINMHRELQQKEMFERRSRNDNSRV